MGYYIRVLARNKTQPSCDALQNALREAKKDAVLTVESGTSSRWEQLILRHANGPEIAMIECNPVSDGELGQDELDEFIEEVGHCKPMSAAEWLKGYLPKIQVIYSLQLLSGTDVDGGWDAVHAVQSAIWQAGGGILQSDGEGFSNEEGYYILWQFSDGAHGTWAMAVIEEGAWISFEMDLASRNQRKAFFEGKVPRGARRL